MAKKIEWTDEQKQYIRDNYANTDTAEMASFLGLNDSAIRRMARVLGVQKSRAFMDALKKKNAQRYDKSWTGVNGKK